MQIFRYATSIYGGDATVIGASWDLLPWFVGAALAFCVLHAVLHIATARAHPAPAPETPGNSRVKRHALVDRAYHSIMGLAVLVLLGTAFLPILGIKFAWLDIHWVAGLVLAACVLFHIIRALLMQDWRAMRPEPRDLSDIAAELRGRHVRTGKYTGLQKLFHLGVAALILAMLASGLLMLLKIDTPFWRRNPYWFADDQWGLIYVVHGLGAMTVLAMVVLHLYFTLRPDQWYLLRGMVRGWITGTEYHRNYDSARWTEGAANQTGKQA